MSDKSSSHLRIVWSQGTRAMSEAISFEIRTICRKAAEPIRAGESIKQQILRAWENLGRPPYWRVRSGWYDDRAGNWSAAAVADFQRRYLAMTERHARRVAEAQAIERAKRGGRGPSEAEKAVAEYRTLVARIEALEAALSVRT